MKHKTWFRLVLKAIGVLLIGMAIPQLIAQMVTIIGGFVTGANFLGAGEFTWYRVGYALGAGLQIAFGLYLLMGGKLIIDAIIPSNRPYCPDCGYELINARGERCPECGVMLPPVAERAAEQGERGA